MQHSGNMVKDALRSKGITQIELASRIGRDQSLISRYLSGRIEISDKAARAIAEVLDMDFEELHRHLQRDRLERKNRRLEMEFKDVLTDSDSGESRLTHEAAGATIVQEAGITHIPMLDSIPASADGWSDKDQERYFLPPDMHPDAENSFAAHVSGDDLTDEAVDEGDIIVVDCNANAEDGDRVLAVVGGRPMLRKIYRRDENIILQASGESKEPVIFLSQKDDFEIVGRLVLCVKIF